MYVRKYWLRRLLSCLAVGAAMCGPSSVHAEVAVELFKVAASDATNSDGFGGAIAMSGGIAVIGAGGDYGAMVPGAAYLFDVATGQELFRLVASDRSARDIFGTSVAIDGQNVLVGSPQDDDSFPGSGSAYLFNAATGQQVMKLRASDPLPNINFGIAVSISDNTGIVVMDRENWTT